MLLNHTIKRVAQKEIGLFFSSPIAYLFMTTFAAVTLFIFFWGESFFARNVSDVRPLFEWMPVLLIFLTSTLTMRMWSDERRSGTLEHVLTLPVPLWHFVVGKFFACLLLLLIHTYGNTTNPVNRFYYRQSGLGAGNSWLSSNNITRRGLH